MNESNLMELINGKDFHIDELGRAVIDNEDVMREINGGIGGLFGRAGSNGGCINSHCRC